MAYLKLLRPIQWVKNLLIFVPIFCAQEFFLKDKLINVSLTFAVFCLTASAMYIINDVLDRKRDQQHPQKQHRPIASGKISLIKALSLSTVFLSTGLFLIYFFVPQIFWPLAIYIISNLIYSAYLKHAVIFDILAISFFYLIRVSAGGVAANVPVSNWLILCVFFVSLVVIIGKRLGEMNQLHKREVLQSYSQDFLKQLLSISAGLTIVSYGLYGILGFHLGNHPTLAVYSIFLVVLGVFRYLYLINFSAQAEYPDKLILQDKVVLGSILSWILFMFYVIYL